MAAVIIQSGDPDYPALKAMHEAQGGTTVYRKSDDTLWKAYDSPVRYIQVDYRAVNSFNKNPKHQRYGKYRYLGEAMLEESEDPLEGFE